MMSLPEPAGPDAMPYGTQRRSVSSDARTRLIKPVTLAPPPEIVLACHAPQGRFRRHSLPLQSPNFITHATNQSP